MATFDSILRSYRADADRRANEEAWWADPSISLSEAIRRASLSEIPSRGRLVRYSHQCRLPPSVLREAAQALTSLEGHIATAASFEELYDLIHNVCSWLCRAGDLYAYDVAHRIGLWRGILPEHIYLHTGTREGARALGIKISGRKMLDMNELPRGLRSLTPAEAEDVLCIYKSYVSRVEPDEGTRGPSRRKRRRC